MNICPLCKVEYLLSMGHLCNQGVKIEWSTTDSTSPDSKERMPSKPEFRRLLIQNPEAIQKELDRLRKIEEKARAYIEAQDAVFASAEVLGKDGHGLPVVRTRDEARESLREALGVKA